MGWLFSLCVYLSFYFIFPSLHPCLAPYHMVGTGCRWQSYGSEGSAGVAFVRKSRGPIIKAGGTSGKRCLRKGKMVHSSEEE